MFWINSLSYICVVCVVYSFCCFFFKQNTAYEGRISDWGSDVCPSDLRGSSSWPTRAAEGPPVASNTFGKLFAVTTFGESHGPAIGCVIDGCAPGLPIDPEDFVHDLARRATGKPRHTSAPHEADEVDILSGTYDGISPGTPIARMIRNTATRSQDYAKHAETFPPRPTHKPYW